MTINLLGRISAVLIALAAIGSTIAYACAGSGGPGPGSWDAQKSSALLSPANDTRSNLLLLLSDRYATPSAHAQRKADEFIPIEFPWAVMKARLSASADDKQAATGWDENSHSRCQSNGRGAGEFIAAVSAASDIPKTDKQTLIAARMELRTACHGNASVGGLSTPTAQAFASYLRAASEFYRGEFDAARSGFQAVSSVANPWLRETSLYMIARTELNRAQTRSFDEYGSLAPVENRDHRAIGEAGAAFAAYLEAYPVGRYTGSARGLMRRVAWLAGNRKTLGSAYSSLVGSTAARSVAGANIALIEEIDLKLLPPGDGIGVTDPTLLAVVDLMRLRQDGRDSQYDWGYRGKRLERPELEAQRRLFKSNQPLFEYLLAVEAFYGRKQPQEVLALIPNATRQSRFSYVQFSRQMLRGFALEALKDPTARSFWLSLLPGSVQPYQREAVELAVAEHDAASGLIERLFTPGGPIRSPLIRHHLIEENAGPALLRHQARTGITEGEREVSLYLLLAGQLHHGLYADFIKDAALVGERQKPSNPDWSVSTYDPIYNDELGRPPLYVFAKGGSEDLAPCPEIHTTAMSLAANPAATRPRLCLAEFIRKKGFDGWKGSTGPRQGVIRQPRGFPGDPLERIAIYRSVINFPGASADDKAFALNRAIRCFAPAGSSSCGGDDIPLSQRKAWFDQLKRDYPQSPWARDLRIYW